jgi:uncharacterized protein
MTDSISQKTARRLALHAQLLDGRTPVAKGKKGVAQAIGHLGYVQIDTIAVIERAHHHTLWTRVPGYLPEHLHEAQATDRTLFEYWGHAASYLPMSDYRFYIPMMRSFFDPKNAWFRGWGEKYGAHLGLVLERIRSEGPLAARDFENPIGRGKGPWWDSTTHPPILADPIGLSQKGSTNHPPILADAIGLSQQVRSTWWDWKPAKAALEMLFWRGELMVRERRKFERIYDLAERVLPEGTDTRPPSPDELGRFIVRRALTALGIAGEKEIRDYIRIGDKEIVAGALKEMLAAAEIVRLTVEGQAAVVYALPDVLAKVGGFRAGPPRVRLLSPFDNLVISRSRLKERFAFDYTLECYVPKHKRNHGYFVLPILFGEIIVGRLDPKAERKTGTFLVRRLALEPGMDDSDGLIPELGRALCSLARFNGCQKVVLENVQPKKIIAPLKRALEHV